MKKFYNACILMNDGIRMWFHEIHHVGQIYFCRETGQDDLPLNAKYIKEVLEQCRQEACERGKDEDCF